MRQPTVITGFSGGGLADVGYRLAGYTPIGAVEYDSQIAEVYRANLGDHIRVESIMDTDWRTFDRPDLLHMSPECKEFSQAKSGGKEGPIQRAQADAICRALETLTPPAFVLENVVGYRRSDYSLPVILRTLERLGYCFDLANINSADFAVPQTRRRLILRAVRGGLVPHLPRPVLWVGWYAAIEDIIDTLPESAFAPWQLARLAPLFGNTLVHPTDQRSMPVRAGDEPVWTLTANIYGDSHAPGPRPRAFLVSPGSDSQRQIATLRDEDQPAMTTTPGADGRMRAFLVPNQNAGQAWGQGFRPAPTPSYSIATGDGYKAFIVDDQHGGQLRGEDGRGLTIRQAADPVFTVQAGSNKPARAWLEQGRVVAMTPRALARFQSIPDDFALPDSRGLACRIVGNAVPSLLAQRIGESLLGVL